MDLALITAQQVAELFILMGLGALGAKTGLLRPEGKQTLSNLLVNLVVPAMIINSYRMDFSPEILRNLLAAFALSILSSLLGLVITLLFTARSKDSRTPIFRFACIFSNAGYMGLPLISALFGSEGLLYASAYFTIFNLLLWTLGYSIVSGSSDPKKVAGSLLRCPAIYAIVVGLVLYLFQIPLPTLITQPMELLGDMNTPLSMLITGMLIASGDLRRILTDKHIWELTVIRMFFIPVLTIAAFAAQLDPNLDEIGDIKTAVSEAVTNCIVHAYRDTIGVISLKCRILPGSVLDIIVKDKGCGIADVTQARTPMYSTGGDDRSGMGFTIMESFMTELKVTSSVGRGTTVHMKRRIIRRGEKT